MRKVGLRLSLGTILVIAGIIFLLTASYGFLFYTFNLLLGVLFSFVGLVLITTSPRGSNEAPPDGVRLFGAIVFLGCLGSAVLTYMQGIFGMYSYQGWYYVWQAFLIITGLFLSILVFKRVSSKYFWHGLLAYLVLLLVFSLFRDFTVGLIPLDVSQPMFYLLVLPSYMVSSSFIVYFLTKKPRQYFHQVNLTFRRTCSIYSSVIVAVSVFFLLIQVLGVPFWWVFSFCNTERNMYVTSLRPQNPVLGENVTFQVRGYGSMKYSGYYEYNETNTRVSIETKVRAYDVYTDENGEATFVYESEPTIIRANEGMWHSLYYVIPANPSAWIIYSFFAAIGAVFSGLIAGAAFFWHFKKRQHV